MSLLGRKTQCIYLIIERISFKKLWNISHTKIYVFFLNTTVIISDLLKEIDIKK